MVENEDWTGGLEEKRQHTAMVVGEGASSKVKKKFRKKEVIQEEFQVMPPELRSILRARGSFTDDQRLVVSNLVYWRAQPACWFGFGFWILDFAGLNW